MTYIDNEVVDAAVEKFGFLVDDHGFKASIQDARGTYLSEIIFESNYLKIDIGVWGQGNELWMIFTPLLLSDAPAFELEDLLNGITENKNHFDENIRKTTEWPIFTHTFPQYFERCAKELRKHCEKILTGDLSQWIEITRQILTQRVERDLIRHARDRNLELDDSDKKDLDLLVTYIISRDPNFSLSGLENEILDELTR